MSSVSARGHSRTPSLVHANGVKAATVAAMATLGTGIPLLWVKHDFALDGWRARLIARRCTEIVCVSVAVSRTFEGTFRRKVNIVYPGVDPTNIDRPLARSQVAAALAADEEAFFVTVVGQLIPGKGHIELIDLMPTLTRVRPNLKLVLIGGTAYDGNERYVRRLEERIRTLGMSHAVRFLGHRDDATTLIAGCDVLAIPSLPASPGSDVEGFPLVALESMAVGTPVVGYRVGGLHEQVGECGVLVALRDRAALSQAIIHLTNDPELRDRLGRCGQRRVHERFTRRQMLDELKRRYREAARR
jgi:glycosyltransferase involved in cell wall biosynthesis